MPFKSVIDIDVDDSAFKRFYDLYHAYAAELEEMPEKWRTVGDAMGESTKGLELGAVTAKDALAIAAAQAGIITEALHNATKAQSGLGQETTKSGKAMQALAKGARSVGSAISTIGSWIVKLGALGGLGALFGGFGIGDLAATAFNRTRSAGQLGLSPGALASFQVNAQQFLGTQALEAAANAQIDITKAGYLAALGISLSKAQAMSPSDLAFEELRRARVAYQEGQRRGIAPLQMPGVSSYLALGGSLGDIRNSLVNDPTGRLLSQAQTRTRNQVGIFEMPPAVRQKWADLEITLSKAGMTIETALINKLAPLAPEIEKLANDVANFITTFTAGPEFDTIVKNTKAALSGLADFLSHVDWKKIGGEIQWVADKLGWMVPQASEKPHPETLKEMLWDNDDWFDKLGTRAKQFGSDFSKQLANSPLGKAWSWGTSSGASVLRAITGQESGGDYSIVNKDTGASGRYQFMPGTAKSYLPDWWVKKYGKTIQGKDASAAWQKNEGHIQDIVAKGYYDMLEAHAYKLSKVHNNAKLIAAGWYGGVGGMDDLAAGKAWTKQRQNGGKYPSVDQYATSVARAAHSDFFSTVLGTVDRDIKQYGKNWIHHLPKDVADFVGQAHLTKQQQTSTDMSEINKTLKAVLARRTQKPVQVSVWNDTASRVAVSMNAATA